MPTPRLSPIALTIATLLTLQGCNSSSDNQGSVQPPPGAELPYFNDWPVINSAIAKDPVIEQEIVSILAMMTLEEKVGQMIQPDLRDVTPEEVAEYHLGSLLNGGGGWPDENKYATAADWANEADKFWLANEAYWKSRGFRVPFMWATDAVHGHNNVFRATVFPHNIGLGAARNPDLIEAIGRATAQEIVATGLDWTFAPTVATPRDYRWGRVYEGYSEDPAIVYEYARRVVTGLQGDADSLKTDSKVISNVKHWVGDGGTMNGVDRGENHYTEEYLRNIHAMGYFSGLEAGAQVVMTSFNSWHGDANHDYENNEDYNNKLHGSRYMVTEVLKEKMGFDGLVVTDWNGHTEIQGCTGGNCPSVVNAGNDILMVTSRGDWQAMYRNIIDQVNTGVIPMERIDDAVTRILRVKMRAGLWDKPQPSLRTHAGNSELLGTDEHRTLAREAVQQSLVLLKNDNDILPLNKASKILIAGSAVDDITKQTGGWSLTWQGDGNTIEDDFPGATTMKMAIENEVGSENVVTSISDADENTVAVVVIGEDPYAEMFGDIKDNQTLEFSTIKSSYMQDLETVKALKEAGLKVVTVFYSGRPLYVNEEINNSDAFVAAWLPGTEAGGITDVLFDNGIDFQGKLSYSWPMLKCSTSINAIAPNLADNWVTPATEQDITGEHAPLFAYGYGLSYQQSSASEHDLNNLPLDPREFGCGMDAPDDGIATLPLEIFGAKSSNEFIPKISGEGTGWSDVLVASDGETRIEGLVVDRINKDHQRDAVNLTFTGEKNAQFFLQTPDASTTDKNAYLNADSTLQFDVRMHTSDVPEEFVLSMHCEWPCLGELKIASALPTVSADYSTMKIPLQCFEEAGMVFPMTNTPFLLFSSSDQQIEMDIANVRFVPKSVDAAEDALDCDNMLPPKNPPLDDNDTNVLDTPWFSTVELETYETESWGPLPDGSNHVTVTQSNDTLSVRYNTESPEIYKGLVHLVTSNPQNLSNHQTNGTLEFELFVHSYGTPVGGDNANTEGLSVKMASESGGTDDYVLGQANYPTGSWHPVSLKISDLIPDNFDLERVKDPLIIFPQWSASQAGVEFDVRNIRIKNQ